MLLKLFPVTLIGNHPELADFAVGGLYLFSIGRYLFLQGSTALLQGFPGFRKLTLETGQRQLALPGPVIRLFELTLQRGDALTLAIPPCASSHRKPQNRSPDKNSSTTTTASARARSCTRQLGFGSPTPRLTLFTGTGLSHFRRANRGFCSQLIFVRADGFHYSSWEWMV